MRGAIMSLAVYFPTAVLLSGVVTVLLGIVILDAGTILAGVLTFFAAYLLMPLLMGLAERADPDRVSSRERARDGESSGK